MPRCLPGRLRGDRRRRRLLLRGLLTPEIA
jgi:hypothetical protein